MEIGELKNIVLMFVLVGVLLGIGILVLDSFSGSVKTVTAATDQNVNVSSGVATLSKNQCKEITAVINNSVGDASYSISFYNVTLTNKPTCAISANLPVGYKYNITYNYYVNTTSSLAADQVSGAITTIPSTWMALIIVVVMLSIVLTLVIRSFSMGGSRK